MSITVKINTVDRTSNIKYESLSVVQRLTSQVDTAKFKIIKAGDKTFVPSYDDDVEIKDGSTIIFTGKITQIEDDSFSQAGGVVYNVSCIDNTYEFDKILASKTYEGQTIAYIIDDIVTSYASGFTSNNATSDFVIERIVFNQVPLSTCLKRLADIVQYDWYIDVDKDVHFFPKETESAPFDLTDTNGNYVYKTLKRTTDGSQVVNRVKVRGGEYEGDTYTDEIVVNGNTSKSFQLPYKFANLTIKLNTVSQNIGIDFIDDFTVVDVLYNFAEKTIRFENPLSDSDVIEFSGNPKVPVFAIAEDPTSIASYGVIEKLLRDNNIKSNEVARKRASAELYAYAEPVVDARFYTYQSGLNVGMTINIQSDLRGVDENLIIKKIDFKMIDPNTFGYQVECVSTKRQDLIDLLQKIIEPEPMDADEREVSEQIFTDTKVVEITEEITNVTAQDGDEDMEIAENYVLDPFGANTNAIYVLAPYTPSSQLDTKREGRLDISMLLT